jgi:hypothetical protein
LPTAGAGGAVTRGRRLIAMRCAFNQRAAHADTSIWFWEVLQVDLPRCAYVTDAYFVGHGNSKWAPQAPPSYPGWLKLPVLFARTPELPLSPPPQLNARHQALCIGALCAFRRQPSAAASSCLSGKRIQMARSLT